MRARITSDFAFGARPIRIENWSLAIENHLPGRPMTDDKLSIFNSQLLSRARSQAPLRSCSNCASISEVVFARSLRAHSVVLDHLVVEHHFFGDDSAGVVKELLAVARLGGFPNEGAEAPVIGQAVHDLVGFGYFEGEFRNEEGKFGIAGGQVVEVRFPLVGRALPPGVTGFAQDVE